MAKKKRKRGMKKETRSFLRVIISIIYIVWGIWSPISAFEAIVALDVPALVSAAVGIMTLLAGIMGILRVRRAKCRAFGIIIFVFSVVSAVLALPAINTNSIINAILAWLFIACI